MKHLLLWIIRLWDRTAFICINCGGLANGWGMRIGTGYACCCDCLNEFEEKRKKEFRDATAN